MRGALVLLSVAVAATGVYNAVSLANAGSSFLLVWGLVFGVGVPVLAIAQAWYVAPREQPGPGRLRPSALILSGVMLAEGAMLPLAERLQDVAQAQARY